MKQGNVQKLFIILMLFCYTCTNILINALVSTQIAKDVGFSVSLPTLTMLIGGGRLKKLGIDTLGDLLHLGGLGVCFARKIFEK